MASGIADKGSPLAWGIVLASGVAILALCAAQFLLTLSQDVAWYVYVESWRDPACRLYVDCFFDPNPPFILWFTTFGRWLGTLTGLGSVDGQRLVFFLVLGLAAALSLYVLRAWGAVAGAILGCALAVFVLLQFDDIGQRDFLAALAMLPYVALVAQRQAGGTISRRWAAAIGLFACLGLCLKPQVATVLVAVELGALRQSLDAPRRRIGEWAGLLGGTGVAAAVLAIDPSYLFFLRRVAEYYPDLQFPPELVWRSFARQLSLPALAPVAAALLCRVPTPARPLLAVFAWAALGAAASFLLQAKSFVYHRAPLDLFVAATAGWAVLAAVQAGARAGQLALASIAIALLAHVPLLGTSASAALAAVAAREGAKARAVARDASPGPADPEEIKALFGAFVAKEEKAALALLLRRAGKEGLLFLSVNLIPLFPAAAYVELPYAGRMQSMWFLPRLLRAARNGESLPDAQVFPAIVAADMARTKPAYLILREGYQVGIPTASFSMAGYLRADPVIGPEFQHYECLVCGGPPNRYDLYRRKSALP